MSASNKKIEYKSFGTPKLTINRCRDRHGPRRPRVYMAQGKRERLQGIRTGNLDQDILRFKSVSIT